MVKWKRKCIREFQKCSWFTVFEYWLCFMNVIKNNDYIPVKWWGLSRGRMLLPVEVLCMFHLHPPLPRNTEIKTSHCEVSKKHIYSFMHISTLAWWSSHKRKTRAHHVPELVESNYKARADSPQSFKGPDVNFNPDPLLNTSVQFPQRTAFTYWNTTHITGRIQLKHTEISAKMPETRSEIKCTM